MRQRHRGQCHLRAVPEVISSSLAPALLRTPSLPGLWVVSPFRQWRRHSPLCIPCWHGPRSIPGPRRLEREPFFAPGTSRPTADSPERRIQGSLDFPKEVVGQCKLGQRQGWKCEGCRQTCDAKDLHGWTLSLFAILNHVSSGFEHSSPAGEK